MANASLHIKTTLTFITLLFSHISTLYSFKIIPHFPHSSIKQSTTYKIIPYFPTRINPNNQQNKYSKFPPFSNQAHPFGPLSHPFYSLTISPSSGQLHTIATKPLTPRPSLFWFNFSILHTTIITITMRTHNVSHNISFNPHVMTVSFLQVINQLPPYPTQPLNLPFTIFIQSIKLNQSSSINSPINYYFNSNPTTTTSPSQSPQNVVALIPQHKQFIPKRVTQYLSIYYIHSTQGQLFAKQITNTTTPQQYHILSHPIGSLVHRNAK